MNLNPPPPARGFPSWRGLWKPTGSLKTWANRDPNAGLTQTPLPSAFRIRTTVAQVCFGLIQTPNGTHGTAPFSHPQTFSSCDYTQGHPWLGCYSLLCVHPHPSLPSVFILTTLAQTTESSMDFQEQLPEWPPRFSSHNNHISLQKAVQEGKKLIILLPQLKSSMNPLGAREESRFWAGLPWQSIWAYDLQEYLTASYYSRPLPCLKLIKRPLCLSWQHAVPLKFSINPLVKRDQRTVTWGQHNQVKYHRLLMGWSSKKGTEIYSRMLHRSN